MLAQNILTSPSKKLAIILAMFCFGIAIGPVFTFISTYLFLWILIGCVLFSVFFPKHHQRFSFFILFMFIFGIFLYAQSEIPRGILTAQDVIDRSVHVTGVVSEEPNIQSKDQRITINQVTISDKPAFGKILVRLNALTSIQYGDTITTACRLQIPEPINGFDYARYLEARGILVVCDFPQFTDVVSSTQFSFIRSILAMKSRIVLQTQRVFVEPHASFLFGLLFGGSVGLDKDWQQDFARTGTAHILAASGFNVSLFTFVFFGWIIQTPLGKKRGAIVTALLLCVYVIMAGASAAVLRAALLGGVVLFGSYIGRRASRRNALLLAASILLFANPRVLLDDVGFQLSFAAVVAIIYLVPIWKNYFGFIPDAFGLRDSVVGSLGVIVFTLPIMLWQFGSVSLVSPFVNVFVLPLIPFVMAMAMIAIAVSFMWVPLGIFVGLPAWAGSWFILAIISVFSSLSFASVSLPFARALALASILCLVIVLWFTLRQRLLREVL